MKNAEFRDAIDELIGTQGPCISITLPTFRTGSDRLEAPIRLKNRLTEAENLLVQEGMRATEAQDLLAPARRLMDDPKFWMGQEEGLAIFIAPNLFRHFWLPMEVEELATVGDEFQVRSLVPMLEYRPYYILALDQHEPRLFRAKGSRIRQVEVSGMPTSLEQSLGPEYSEKQRQVHTAGPIGQAGSLISHGAGDRGADAKDRVKRFVQAVDHAVCDALADVVSPLVVIGDEPALSMFLQQSHYPNVHRTPLRTSPKLLTPEDMLERTRALVEPILTKREDTEKARFARMAGTGLTSDDVDALMRESEIGRVEVLFVNRFAHKWDRAAAEGHKEDILNRLEVETLRNSGTVYELAPDEMPTATPVAGIYRY